MTTDIPGREIGAQSNDKDPLVTFALFAYNQEKYIRDAVEGAFSQTYEPLEIILSDDCSSDQTFEIMEDMASRYQGPHSVRVRRQPVNDGLLNHVCAVISEMRGEIMVLAAGDDVSVPIRVETVIASWTTECLAIYSACDLINEHGKTVQRKWAPQHGARTRFPWLKEFKSELFVYGASSSYHKTILQNLPRSYSKVFSEDTPLNLLTQFSTGRINFCSEPLVRYRIHNNTISSVNLSLRPSFKEVMREEKGRLRKILIQRNILIYLKDILVPSASAHELVDLDGLQSEIEFCDLRIKWYCAPSLQRANIIARAPRRSWRWLAPRLLGMNVYVTLRCLLFKFRPESKHSNELKS